MLSSNEELSVTLKCARPVWDEIVAFAMEGFSHSPSGGPEWEEYCSGGDFGDGVRISRWREIPCEHSRGPQFELSEQDEGGLRRLLAEPSSDGLEVVGWFQSKYWEIRWSHSQQWEFGLNAADRELFAKHFTEPWHVCRY